MEQTVTKQFSTDSQSASPNGSLGAGDGGDGDGHGDDDVPPPPGGGGGGGDTGGDPSPQGRVGEIVRRDCHFSPDVLNRMAKYWNIVNLRGPIARSTYRSMVESAYAMAGRHYSFATSIKEPDLSLDTGQGGEENNKSTTSQHYYAAVTMEDQNAFYSGLSRAYWIAYRMEGLHSSTGSRDWDCGHSHRHADLAGYLQACDPGSETYNLLRNAFVNFVRSTKNESYYKDQYDGDLSRSLANQTARPVFRCWASKSRAMINMDHLVDDGHWVRDEAAGDWTFARFRPKLIARVEYLFNQVYAMEDTTHRFKWPGPPGYWTMDRFRAAAGGHGLFPLLASSDPLGHGQDNTPFMWFEVFHHSMAYLRHILFDNADIPQLWALRGKEMADHSRLALVNWDTAATPRATKGYFTPWPLDTYVNYDFRKPFNEWGRYNCTTYSDGTCKGELERFLSPLIHVSDITPQEKLDLLIKYLRNTSSTSPGMIDDWLLPLLLELRTAGLL